MTELNFDSLQDIKVPEERQSARNLALQSAMSEFEIQKSEKSRGTLAFFKQIQFDRIPDYLPRATPASGALAGVFVVILASTIFLYNPVPDSLPESSGKKKDTVELKERDDAALPETTAPLEAAREKEVSIEKPKKRLMQRRSYAEPNQVSQPQQGIKIDKLHAKSKNPGIVADSKPSVQSMVPPVVPPRQPLPTGLKIYNAPIHAKHPLHYCLQLSTECGKPVADLYCKKQGYTSSVTAIESKVLPNITASIKGDQIFVKKDGVQPRTFQYISCKTP